MKNKKIANLRNAHKQLCEKGYSDPGVAQVVKTYEQFVKLDSSYKEYLTATRSVGFSCHTDSKTKN